jgi:filamentous hemagglutinin
VRGFASGARAGMPPALSARSGLDVGKYARRTDVTLRSASDVNASFPSGYSPPYKPGTRVTEFTTTVDEVFVRAHGESNMARAWMMRREAIDGLSASEIRAKYALPELPSRLSYVYVPAGTRIRAGTVNPVFGGVGNATQYELLQRLPASAFGNTVGIK